MPEFLVEIYAPRNEPGVLSLRVGDIERTTEQPGDERTPVRFLGAIFVPEDETCFYLCQSSSADAVRDAVVRAELRSERITEAVSSRWATVPAADAQPSRPEMCS